MVPMAPAPPALPMIHGRVLAGILDGSGLPDDRRAELLAAAGLDQAAISGMAASVPLATYLALFDRLAQLQGRPSLGLELAARMEPGLVGPVGYVLLHSPTVASGLSAFAQGVFSIQGVTELRFERDPAALHYLIHDEALQPRRQDVEFSLGYVHALLRRGLAGQFAPREVHFEHRRVGDLATYEQAFGCPVHFEQDRNALLLDPADLPRAMAASDPTLVALLRHYLDLLDDREGTPAGLADTVGAVLAGLIGPHRVTIRQVAARLGRSPETLRRQLAAEGLSFRALLRARRVALACRLLRDSGMSVLQVALRVGYTEGASFTRAFAAETGLPPADWRRRQRS